MEKLISCLLILHLISGIKGISLESEGDLIVFEEGSVEEILLDCPYDLEEDEDIRELVVKWSHEDSVNPFFQWIPSKEPKVITPALQDKVVPHSMNEDELKVHRSIRLINPTSAFSGVFTCIVSTFKDEKTYSRRIIAYSPPTDVKLTLETANDTHVVVLCVIDGTFPEPFVSITQSSADGRHDLEEVQIEKTWHNEKYNLTAQAEIADEALIGLTRFECEMTLPETTYKVSRIIEYNPIQGGVVEIEEVDAYRKGEKVDKVENNVDNTKKKKHTDNVIEAKVEKVMSGVERVLPRTFEKISTIVLSLLLIWN